MKVDMGHRVLVLGSYLTTYLNMHVKAYREIPFWGDNRLWLWNAFRVLIEEYHNED